MPRRGRVPPEIGLIKEALGEAVKSFTRIKEGQDGEKFVVETDSGAKLFCRVKKLREGQELPYQEAAVLEATTSPHIIRPLKVDTIRGNYIIIRPYIEGTSLSNRIASGPMTQEEVARLASALIASVENLQDTGAVHFDIKPENIVAGSDGEFYLIDFGAAKVLKKIRGEKLHPARRYIAPEVLEYLFKPTDLGAARLSSLTDMYGVGAVLYATLTGKKLSDIFFSSSDVLQKSPPLVRQVRSDVDPGLADMVDRLLAKNPSRRLHPRDALAVMSGTPPTARAMPSYFLKTKGGRGSEHSSMLPVIAEEQDRVGIYWRSATSPSFNKKTLILNLLWEGTIPETDADLEKSLLNQQGAGVMGLCVPGNEIESPVQTEILSRNTDLIQKAAVWKRNNASHLPLLPVLSIDSSLLLSGEIGAIRDAYAAQETDGLILRVCVATYGEVLDARHLHAIRELIEPWSSTERPVLYDGDLNALILSRSGVTNLISSTFPRQQILTSRTPPPGYRVRPDGFYVHAFLGNVGPDRVTSLRGKAVGRNLTNCPCRHCALSLMRRNRFANWTREERRKHFVSAMPREMDRMSRLSPEAVRSAIENARREIGRFKRLVPMEIPHLEQWSDLLLRDPRL